MERLLKWNCDPEVVVLCPKWWVTPQTYTVILCVRHVHTPLRAKNRPLGAATDCQLHIYSLFCCHTVLVGGGWWLSITRTCFVQERRRSWSAEVLWAGPVWKYMTVWISSWNCVSFSNLCCPQYIFEYVWAAQTVGKRDKTRCVKAHTLISRFTFFTAGISSTKFPCFALQMLYKHTADMLSANLRNQHISITRTLMQWLREAPFQREVSGFQCCQSGPAGH